MTYMKQIIAFGLIILLMAGLFSCENEDWSFPDFDYTTTYFPYQYPVRTLVLGDYYFDNTNDNLNKFLIGAHMGGVYMNKEDIKVDIQVDNSLANNLYNATTGSPMKALPANYYTLSNNSQIIIPKGEVFGTVEVQLTDAFFDDTLTIGANYVIPMKILSSTTDSVLSGRTQKTDPDPRIAADWTNAPKNFTLFGIKYVNEYHGKYLLRGTSVVKDAGGNTLETIVYRQKYVERNPVVMVSTYRKNAVLYTNSIRRTSGSPGSFEISMAFNANGTAAIANTPKSAQFPTTGTAKFVKNADEWGGKERNAIYLDYKIQVGTETHEIKDTLVFRDKAIIFEEFVPKIVVP